MTMYENGAFVLFGNDAAIYSDIHKDVYGFRPRNERVFTSIEELDKEFKYLQDEVNNAIEFDKLNNEMFFNNLKNDIAKNITFGAENNRSALKWILQSYDIENDSDDNLSYLLFHYGINEYFKYVNLLKELLKE